MSFPSDGRNHIDSINVEKSMPKYKKQYESYYGKTIKDITHIGGTQTVIDFKIEFNDGTVLNKSLKKKKRLDNGSFDYVNTSDFNKSLIPNSFSVYEKYKGINDKTKKNVLIESICEDLINMDNNVITELIKNKVIDKYRKINGLDIVETNTDKLYINIEPGFFKKIEDGGYFEINNSNKKQMSYKLNLYDKDGNLQSDTGLRIRLHLNNGWTKWFHGKSSNLVIKIQQDKVNKLLKQ
jgi:hypothetical protein